MVTGQLNKRCWSLKEQQLYRCNADTRSTREKGSSAGGHGRLLIHVYQQDNEKHQQLTKKAWIDYETYFVIFSWPLTI